MATPCILCAQADTEEHARDRLRSYLRCTTCGLVFVPPRWHPDATQERARYDLHQNDPDDPGYRSFLARLADPLLERIPPNSEGLDFGCGPGPTLSRLFTDAGHRVALYDPFYAPDCSVLGRRYAFVTASEVIEHLHDPCRDLDLLWSLVDDGGWLGLMTESPPEGEAFDRWHYKNDPTHVAFYPAETLRWLARRWGAEPQAIGASVTLLRRPDTATGVGVGS